MLAWFSENIGNILVIGILALALILVIRYLVKQRRAGGTACAGCPSACQCEERHKEFKKYKAAQASKQGTGEDTAR